MFVPQKKNLKRHLEKLYQSGFNCCYTHSVTPTVLRDATDSKALVSGNLSCDDELGVDVTQVYMFGQRCRNIALRFVGVMAHHRRNITPPGFLEN